jgi:undecaprenyl diphosphate synthase
MNDSLEHIAFILDGNRRWAKENNLPPFMGHKEGYEKAKELAGILAKYGIKYATYYVFSSENWNRSAEEIAYLMEMFRNFFIDASNFFQNNNIRIRAIGNLEKLPRDLWEKIKKIEEETKNNSGLTLIPAVSYSSREEITRATKKIVSDVLSGKININGLTEDTFASYLDTDGIPYPDALIRTSEKRISNFLTWQLAYSEIFFIDKYWPDFSEEDLKNVIVEYSKRNRRYGR